MDKQWIHNPNRCADEYLDGINQFIDFAIANNRGLTQIRCPCRKCNNLMIEYFETVQHHLVRNGMMETYTTWNKYNMLNPPTLLEQWIQLTVMDPNDQIMDIINDAFPTTSSNTNVEVEDDIPPTMDSEAFQKYEKLLKSAKQELYLGCEGFSMLLAIVELMHGKTNFRMLNQCFDYFFGVFKRMFPKDNCLPKDHRSAKKVLSGLGLGYEKIDECKNNCSLFYKENKALDKCPICNKL
ncbi:hypothetical protein ACFX2B_003208 [Malus domestica]